MRAILDETDPECPTPLNKHSDDSIEQHLEEHQKLKLVVKGNPQVNENEMPYRFPVKVCGLMIGSDSPWREAVEAGLLTLSHNNITYEVPAAPSDPSRFLLIGDTGLRMKPDNLGLGELGKNNLPDGPDCTAPEIYGIHQCKTNFTQADLNYSSMSGSYQGLDEWYFKEMCDSAANENIDVIVYVSRGNACSFWLLFLSLCFLPTLFSLSPGWRLLISPGSLSLKCSKLQCREPPLFRK